MPAQPAKKHHTRRHEDARGLQWPGNVRELENVIQRSVTLSDGTRLTWSTFISTPARRIVRASGNHFVLPEGMTLDQWEQETIREALSAPTAIKARPRVMLGLSRNALRYRLSQMGVADPAEASNEKAEMSSAFPLPPICRCRWMMEQARNLPGMRMPAIELASTRGSVVNLDELREAPRTIIYCYPMTGVPGKPLPEGWDDIPGARGCTPQTCGFRDQYQEVRELGAEVFGLSTQTSGVSARDGEASEDSF